MVDAPLSTTGCTCHRELENPLPRYGKIADVLARLTIAQLRTLWSTLLQLVRATDTQTPHRPHGKVADALASTHASTTVAHSPVNYSGYVPHRPETFPSPQWETHVARCLQGGGVYVGGGTVSIVNSQIYSNTAPNVRAHLQNFPSPRWDFHCFALLCLQAGGVFINSGTVTLSSCTITGNTASSVRAHAQNFPSPRWETHILLVNCNNRAAVSMSRAAQ